MPRIWYFHLQLHSWLTNTAWPCVPAKPGTSRLGRQSWVLFLLNLYPMLMAFRGENPTQSQVCTPPLWLASHWVAVLCVHGWLFYGHTNNGGLLFLGGIVNLGVFCSICEATVMPRAEGRRRKVFQLWRRWGLLHLHGPVWSSAAKEVWVPKCHSQRWNSTLSKLSQPFLCLSCMVTRGTKKPFADSHGTEMTQDSSLLPASTLTQCFTLFFSPHREIINPARPCFQWQKMPTLSVCSKDAHLIHQQRSEFNNTSLWNKAKLICNSHL